MYTAKNTSNNPPYLMSDSKSKMDENILRMLTGLICDKFLFSYE